MNKTIFAETSAALTTELDEIKQVDAEQTKIQQAHVEKLETELAVCWTERAGSVCRHINDLP
jgi:hypothetical protein